MWRSILAVVLVGALAGQTVRADTIRLATFTIPLMVESSNQGVFIDLVKEIGKRIGHQIEIEVYPPNRTVFLFRKGKVDGFFPALDVMFHNEVAKSSTIYVKEDFAFVKKGRHPPGSIDDMKGKTVGLTTGYPYVKEITQLSDTDFDFVAEDQQNVRKLLSDRIDVFVVEEMSGLKAAEGENALDEIDYHTSSPLSRQDVYFAFQNMLRGKSYAKIFSSALAAMREDGTFSTIMAAAGR